MFRTPTFLNAVRQVALALVFCLSALGMAKADLGISILTQQDGDLLIADVAVSGFVGIESFQVGLSWNPNELEFQSVDNFNMPTMTSDYFGTTEVDLGHLRSIWYYEGAGLSLTLPDCTPIYRVSFKVLGSQVSPILIDPSVMTPEAINDQVVEVPIVQGDFCSNMAYIMGTVFKDINGNCSSDPFDVPLEGSLVRFDHEGATFFHRINADGAYYMPCPAGTWELTMLLPETGNFTACQSSFTINALEGQTVLQDFGAQELTSAAQEGSEQAAIQVYPNPVQAGQAVTLELNGLISNEYSFEVFDISGKCLQQKKYDFNNSASVKIDLPDLKQGVYLVEITTLDNASQVIKLVIY